MRIYVTEEAAHIDSDLPALIAAAELGDRIERHLRDPKSPFSMMLDRAREEFIAATSALLDADLTTVEGIELARSQQAKALRYKDMCAWITDALEAREAAAEAIDDEEEDPAVEQLKDQLYGNRSKPASDA
ncbi:MAG: hypothetical protein ABFD96_06010 [Armatimonadia bacterium]